MRRAGFAYYKDICLVLGGGAFLIERKTDMDLVTKYLDDVQKVNGVYVMQIGDEVSHEDMDNIYKGWKKTLPDETLIMLPKEISVHYRNKYSFYIAMMLVRQGYHLSRLAWTIQAGTKKDAPYLKLQDCDGKKVVVLKFPNNEADDEFFIPFEDDMDAEDYILIEKR